MILKVKVNYEDRDWWILDDIRRVVVSKQIFSHLSKEEHIKSVSKDIDICLLSNSNDKKGVKYIRLSCRKTNGEEFLVIFDTVAYLCNDEGKTVEKIVVT